MVTTQLQLRRDTTTNIAAITPAQGEPIYDVTREALVLGDGSTAGGLCVSPFSGTWTPALQGGTTNPTVTYAVQTGWWIQIGKIVIAQGTISISAISGGSGILEIGGLPVASIAGGGTGGVAAISTLGGFTFHSGSYSQVGLVVLPNGTLIEFEEAGSGVANYASTVGQAGSTFTISFVAIYQAAQPTG